MSWRLLTSSSASDVDSLALSPRGDMLAACCPGAVTTWELRDDGVRRDHAKFPFRPGALVFAGDDVMHLFLDGGLLLYSVDGATMERKQFPPAVGRAVSAASAGDAVAVAWSEWPGVWVRRGGGVWRCVLHELRACSVSVSPSLAVVAASLSHECVGVCDGVRETYVPFPGGASLVAAPSARDVWVVDDDASVVALADAARRVRHAMPRVTAIAARAALTAVGMATGTVLSVEHGKRPVIRVLGRFAGAVTAVAVSEDGAAVAATDGGEVRWWGRV